MPEPSHSSERDDGDRPRGKSKSSKPKDLSHVPCKFFKVGGCTAGPDCPFSHQQPGQPKDVCTWFVKGQCKFGHKCALAHVLPGQPMSMDRKNKKEAQQAAQRANANGSGSGGGASASGSAGDREKERERDRARKRRDVRGSMSGDAMRDSSEGHLFPEQERNASQRADDDHTLTFGELDTGASPPGPTIRIRQPTGAPTHKVSPVQITAPIPAPPVSATDFAFGIPDDLDLPHPEPGSVAAGTSTSSGTAGGSSIPMAIPSPNKNMLPPRMQAQRRSSGGAADPMGRSPPGFERLGQSRPASLAISPPGAGFGHDQSVISPTRKRASGTDFGFGPIGSPSRANFMQQGTSPPAPQPGSARNGISSQFSPGTSPVGNGNGNGYLSTMSTSPFEGDKGLFMSYSLDSRALSGAISGFAGRERERERLIAIQERSSLRPLRGDGNDDAAVEDDDLEDFIPSSLTDLLTPEERQRRKSRTGTRPSLERFPASLPATSHLDGLRGIWGDGPALPATSPPPSAGLRGSMLEEHHSPSLLSTSNQSTAFLNHTLNRPQMQSLRSFDPHLLIDRPSLSGEPSQRMMGHGNRASRTSLDASQRLAPYSSRDTVPPEHMPGQSLPQGLAAGLSRLHLLPSQQSPIPTPGTTPGASFAAGMDMWTSAGRTTTPGMGMSWEHRSLAGLAAGQTTPGGAGSGSGMHTPSGSWREAYSPNPNAWGGRDVFSSSSRRDAAGAGAGASGAGEISLSYSVPRGLGMGLGSTQTTPSKPGAAFTSSSSASSALGGSAAGGSGAGLGRGRTFGEHEDMFDLDLEVEAGPRKGGGGQLSGGLGGL